VLSVAGFFALPMGLPVGGRFIPEVILPAAYYTFLTFRDINVEHIRTSQESEM